MRSDVFGDLAWLVHRESTTPGQATHDTGAGNLGRRRTQRGINTGKVYNATSSHCSSLLFSKIVEKLKIKVVKHSYRNSCESRTTTAFTHREKGWRHRYQFSALLEERYIGVYSLSDRKILLAN
uniref:Uncharacterized protein n=1 Tax=Rhipicephalus zambeziensis TaxID=60191 RepID=A0A224YCQ6_9ACAR